MTITVQAAPVGADRLIAKAMSHLTPSASPARPGFRMVTRPVPIYAVEPGQLAADNALALARQVGWRCLVESSNGMAAADLAADDKGALRFHSLHRNRSCVRLLDAANLAAASDNSSTVRQLRLLVIPSLHVEALWLAGKPDEMIELKPKFAAQLAPAGDVLDQAMAAHKARAAAYLAAKEGFGG
jgi:hypothetical protein